MPENLCSGAFRLLAKWKRTLDDWENERNKELNLERNDQDPVNIEGNDRSPDYEDVDTHNHGNGNFIKRTHDQNRERPKIRGKNVFPAN